MADENAAAAAAPDLTFGEPVPDWSELPSVRQKREEESDDSLNNRFRLNAVNSFYRGTVGGAGRLASMAAVMTKPEEDLTDSDKAFRKLWADEYPQIVGDLERYDKLRPWGTTLEGATALGGTLYGGLWSPENLAGLPAQGATWAARTVRAAVQQAAITGAADPIVQWLNRESGPGVAESDHWDPWRTLTAAGLGAIVGGGLHAGGELIGAAQLKKIKADLARQDPGLLGEMEFMQGLQADWGNSAKMFLWDKPEATARWSPEAIDSFSPEFAMQEAERLGWSPPSLFSDAVKQQITHIQQQIAGSHITTAEGEQQILDLLTNPPPLGGTTAAGAEAGAATPPPPSPYAHVPGVARQQIADIENMIATGVMSRREGAEDIASILQQFERSSSALPADIQQQIAAVQKQIADNLSYISDIETQVKDGLLTEGEGRQKIADLIAKNREARQQIDTLSNGGSPPAAAAPADDALSWAKKYVRAAGGDWGALSEADAVDQAKASVGSFWDELTPETQGSFIAHQIVNAPKAKVAPPAPPAPPAKPAIEDASAWTQTGPQKGSNPGGTYKDAKGVDWYIKTPKTEDHARNEILANRLYALAGADVPDLKLVTMNGQPAVASRMLTTAVMKLGKLKAGSSPEKNAVAALRRDFATDAWLANHDVIGLTGDNVMVKAGGANDPVRIDQGGALRFRAKGGDKANFGPKVLEFDSMRDPAIAPQAAPIFKPMTDQELVDSINRVLVIPEKDVRDAVKQIGPLDAAENQKLADTLVARQDDLKKIREGLKAKIAAASATPVPPAPPAGATTAVTSQHAVSWGKHAGGAPLGPTNAGTPLDPWVLVPGGSGTMAGKAGTPHLPGGPALKSAKEPKDWNKAPGIDKALAKTEVSINLGATSKKPASGVIIREPDGRVWIVAPANQFGGYEHTFPKGKTEPGLSYQANAIKEAFEESGLKVKITGIVGDFEGDTSITRYYWAERTGGHPKDAHWESEAVRLVPASDLFDYLNKARDHEIAKQAFGTALKPGKHGDPAAIGVGGTKPPSPPPFTPKYSTVADSDAARNFLKTNLGNVFTDAQVDAMPAAEAIDKATQNGWTPPGAPKSKSPGIPTSPGNHPTLPMDQAARYARAAAMGFDTSKIWYHGVKGSKTFEAFDIIKNKSEPAIFLSPDEHVGHAFGGGKPYAFFSRAKKIMVVDPPPGMTWQPYSHSVFKQKIKEAKAQGYDAVLFVRTSDVGGVSDQLAVLHTNLLRSIHAAFDPAEAASPKLAAIKPKGKGLTPEEFASSYDAIMNEARDATVDAQGRPQESAPAAEGPAHLLSAPPSEPHPSGLPMDQAARFARAAAQGFNVDKTWWHGTHGTHRTLDIAKAAGENEPAIFLTGDPQGAAMLSQKDYKPGTPYPLFMRGDAKIMEVAPKQAFWRDLLKLSNKETQFYNHDLFKETVEKARAEGYDAVLFRNVHDIDATGDQLAVLNPDMLRSAHDAFAPPQKPELQAIAQRKSGGTLAGEQQRPAAGVPGAGTAVTTPAGTAVTPPGAGAAGGAPGGAPAGPSPQQAAAITSLQQQVTALAKALGMTLHEGRVQMKGALATFNTHSGVTRAKEIPDLVVVAHEAGHHIEAHVGQDLTNLTNQFGHELGPLDYEWPAEARPAEGFAEFIRYWIGNLGTADNAQAKAPGFHAAFTAMMQQKAPEMLKALDDAAKAFQAYQQASSVEVVGAAVRFGDEEGNAWARVQAKILANGLPTVTRTVLQNIYTALLDDKAPVARAVRELVRAIRDRDPNHALVNLKAAENPEFLLRLAARSQQAAVLDMMDGVRPYRSITPEGPSLAAAISKAVGEPAFGGFGKWNREKTREFSAYLVARRAEVLWRRFEAGDLPNPPAAFSKADALQAIADHEAANPTFREAGDMAHGYTRELLRKQYEGGLIDADLYEKLRQEEFYVPFMRDMRDKPLTGEASAGSGAPAAFEGPGMTKTIKGIKGSSRDILDPLESIMMQTFLVNRTLRHNDVIRSFVELARNAGIEGGKYVEVLPAHEAKRYTFDLGEALEKKALEHGSTPQDAKLMAAQVAQLFGEDPLMGSFFKMEPAAKRGEPLVFYKEGGKLKVARFMSEKEGHALYETLTHMPEPITDIWHDLVRGAAVIKRTGIVANPTFALSNYIRDQVAVFLLRGDYIPFVSGLKGIWSEVRQGEAAKLYGYAGGVAGGAATGPVERAAEAEIAALARQGYLVNRVTSFKGLLELSSITEAGTRNSVFDTVFKAKKAQGLSDYEAMIEAAYQAQDILDFSRHGSRTLAIRNILPFINAHMQGLDKAWRTIADPIARKAAGRQALSADSAEFRNALNSLIKVGGVGAALGVGWAALNWDNEAYRDASPYFKGTHFIVPFGNKLFVVPKPFELSAGFTAGEYAFARLMQDDPRAGRQFMEAVWHATAPPNLLTDIPLVSTTTELLLGKSLFTGNDIVPGELQKRSPIHQYNDRTSSLAKHIGRMIGVSPMKVDYAIGSSFGTWGRDIMALSAGVDEDSPTANWEDRVFTRRFIKDPTRTSDVTTKFWQYMGRTTGTYRQAVTDYDDYVKQGAGHEAEAREFLDHLPGRERAFVTLKSAGNDFGRAAFGADEQRLHPLNRAYDAAEVLNHMRRDLVDNNLSTWQDKTPLKLDPDTRRDLIEDLRELAQMEMRNAFVIMKEPGYATRPLLDVQPVFDRIAHISEQVSEEISTRYATSRILTTRAVAEAYPQMEKALLQDGSEAHLDTLSLALEAKADGYEFQGTRTRKPQKPRLVIPGQPAAAGP